MGLFFPSDDEKLPPNVKRTGFNRYKQLLGRDFKEYYLINLPALLSFVPLGVGIGYAVLSTSILLLVPFSLIGGMIAGQGIAAMYDFLLRRERDVEDHWWICFKRSIKQNWRSALLPGAIEGLFIGAMVFVLDMIVQYGFTLTIFSAVLLVAAVVIFCAIFSVWWPQRVLFTQKAFLELKNTLYFFIKYPKQVLGTAALQAVYWIVFALLVPYSAFLVPVLGIWYILFVSVFFLYNSLNEAFRIEEQIFAQFPEQRPIPDPLEEE